MISPGQRASDHVIVRVVVLWERAAQDYRYTCIDSATCPGCHREGR